MSSLRVEEAAKAARRTTQRVATAHDPLQIASTEQQGTTETELEISAPVTEGGDDEDNVAADVMQTITRTLTIEVRGSLSKLAAGGQAARWGADKSASSIFQPKDTDKGFANRHEKCDIKSAVLHEMKITEIRSNFPCSLGVTISGVQGQHFTKEAVPYAKVILQDTVWSGCDTMVEADEMTNSEYLRKYPGMNRENLSKVGILKVPDEDFVFVDMAHPIVEMLQVNQSVLQVDMSEAQLVDGRWYKVATQVVEDCTRLLDQQLLQHLPIIDLTQFEVCFERTGKMSWDSTSVIADSIPPAAQNYDGLLERVMTKSNAVQLQIEMTYGFM